MKQVNINIAAFVLFIILITSCKTEATEIKISEIKTACQLLDAVEIVLNEIEQFKRQNTELYELMYGKQVAVEDNAESQRQKEIFSTKYDEVKKIKKLKAKLNELRLKANKSFVPSEFEECKKFDVVSKRLRKI